MMIIQYNSLGVITSVDTSNASFRQGSKGEVIQAVFAGKSNSNHVAKINFTRPDGTAVQNLIMSPDPSDQSAFLFELDDLWFLAISGIATMTIFLYNASNVIQAQGQVTIPIESTDYDDEPTITQTQYDSLLTALAGKLGMPVSSLRVDELPEEGTTGVFYVIHDDPNDTTRVNIYVWNSTTREYIWVGSNELDLNKYYTKQEGQAFETQVGNRIAGVENQVQQAASGSPKGVYATLEALQAAYPTGTSGIYLVSANGHWYYWNGSAWADGGQYLSAGNETKADIRAINNTIEKEERANFFGRLSQVYTPTGYQSFQGWYSTDFIDIDEYFPSKVYVAVYRTIYTIAFFDESYNFISGVLPSANNDNDALIVVSFTAPANAKYYKVASRQIASQNSQNNPAIYYIRNIGEEFDELKADVNDFRSSTQMLNKSALTDNQIYTTTGFNTYGLWYSTDYIDLTNVLSISKIVASTYRNLYSYAFFDENYNFISGHNDLGNHGYKTFENISIPAGAKYLRAIASGANDSGDPTMNSFNITLNTKLDISGIADQIDKINNDMKYTNELSFYFDKVLFIGDSLTQGDYGSEPEGTLNLHKWTYPYYYGKITNCEIYNKGMSGATAVSYLNNVLPTIDTNKDYDAIYIFLGTNGGLGGTKTDPTTQLGAYYSIVNWCKTTFPKAHIFLLNFPFNKRGAEWTITLSQVVASIASELNVNLIDIMNKSPFTRENGNIYRPVGYDPDTNPYGNLHFGRYGYLTLAQVVIYCTNEIINNNKEDYALGY